MWFSMYKRKASVAPDHPRRTGRFCVERCDAAAPRGEKSGDDYRRTIVLDCRSKGGVPSRPLPKEQDEEVAVLELQRVA